MNPTTNQPDHNPTNSRRASLVHLRSPKAAQDWLLTLTQ